MGLRWEFSWPKLWECKGHRCAGLPRALICTVWVFSPSQLSAVWALESIYKRSLWLCLFVGKCILYASWSWLAGWNCCSQSAVHHWVSASQSLSTSLPRGSRAGSPPRLGRWGLQVPVQEPTRPRQRRRRRWSCKLEKCVILEWLLSLFSNKR